MVWPSLRNGVRWAQLWRGAAWLPVQKLRPCTRVRQMLARLPTNQTGSVRQILPPHFHLAAELIHPDSHRYEGLDQEADPLGDASRRHLRFQASSNLSINGQSSDSTSLYVGFLSTVPLPILKQLHFNVQYIFCGKMIWNTYGSKAREEGGRWSYAIYATLSLLQKSSTSLAQRSFCRWLSHP